MYFYPLCVPFYSAIKAAIPIPHIIKSTPTIKNVIFVLSIASNNLGSIFYKLWMWFDSRKNAMST